jgi:hypothetical protein
VLNSVLSVSTRESHWSGVARLPFLRVRIGPQATSDAGGIRDRVEPVEARTLFATEIELCGCVS